MQKIVYPPIAEANKCPQEDPTLEFHITCIVKNFDKEAIEPMKYIKLGASLLIFLWLQLELAGQPGLPDTLPSWKRRVVLGVGGGAGNIYPLAGREVHLPEFIRQERERHNPYNTPVEQQTDEPFNHTAIWLRFGAKAFLFKQNALNLELLTEYRGESFGVYSLRNMAVVPLINLLIDDSIKVFKKDFQISGKIGFLENVFVDQGLMFYNFDAQGTSLALNRQNYSLKLDVLGDLLAGHGLNIDDAITLALKRRNRTPGPRRRELSFSLTKLTRAPNLTAFENKVIPSLSYNVKSRLWQTGIQIAWRFDDPKVPIPGLPKLPWIERGAGTISTKLSIQRRRLHSEQTWNARYYGRFFNVDNYNPIRPFRDFARPAHGNYAGTHLYPLKNYLYNFSQWAVFTEYEVRNVGGLFWLSDNEIHLKGNLWTQIKLDLAMIVADNLSPFTYPFYTAGFSWKFRNVADLKLIATNKIMNLDIHYQTFYLTKEPYIGLLFTADLNYTPRRQVFSVASRP